MSSLIPPPPPGQKPAAPAAGSAAAGRLATDGSGRGSGRFAAALSANASPPAPSLKPAGSALSTLGSAVPPTPQAKPLTAALVAAGLTPPATPGQKPLAAALVAAGLNPPADPGQKPLAAAVAAAGWAQLPPPGSKPAAAGATLAAALPASGNEEPGAATPVPGTKPTAPLLTNTGTGSNSGSASEANPYEVAARSVSRITDIPVSDIMARASQESEFNAGARSRISSAAGPFQFIESTWLTMLKRHGAAYGLGAEASKIELHNGVARVRDPATRKHLLDLRHDINLSTGMAARYMDEAGQDLGRLIQRDPSATERRIAYVLGPGGAAKLIKAAAHTPEGSVTELLPQAAHANRSLFYRNGEPLTNAGALARISHYVNRQLDRFPTPNDQKPLITDVLHGNDSLG